MSARLYLVRHPPTLAGKDVCIGRTDVGVAGHEFDLTLSALLPVLPTNAHLYSSPRQRCTGLGDRIATHLGHVHYCVDERLAEMDFGAWEGLAWSQIAHAEVNAWAADTAFYRPGNGENVFDLVQRVHAAIQDMRTLERDCLVVCHAGTIRAAKALMEATELEHAAQLASQGHMTISYGSLTVLDI